MFLELILTNKRIDLWKAQLPNRMTREDITFKIKDIVEENTLMWSILVGKLELLECKLTKEKGHQMIVATLASENS